ncbi:MAG TPA: hypothetical protein VN131_00765, partial [Mobilitalea sp.]|nr:hypothetical protein [Mobilitalea sp.]
MRKSKKIIACLVTLITVLVPATSAFADTNFYTYNYDYFGVQYESPDAYSPEADLFGSNLGNDVGDFKNPLGMFIKDENIFIADSGNNRIVEVDKNFNLIRIIDKVVVDGKESQLKNPQDVFVAENGDIYICDSDNFRILHLDKDLNVIYIYTKPDDVTIAKDQNFIPQKAVADKAGRLFVLAANVNKGFMEFDEQGKFTGYVGANKVKVSFFEVMQKRLMTKAQRDRMQLFVPTEYSNLAIDQDNFLYATTTTFDPNELDSGVASPIRRINSLGDDILIRNGYYNPIGELWWGTGGDVSGPSRFMDITAMDNDTYFAVDRVRGRIFGYDFQGNLLYA